MCIQLASSIIELIVIELDYVVLIKMFRHHCFTMQRLGCSTYIIVFISYNKTMASLISQKSIVIVVCNSIIYDSMSHVNASLCSHIQRK